MFGEAAAIDTLRIELCKTIRESTTQLSNSCVVLGQTIAKAINDSAKSRDEKLQLLIDAIEASAESRDAELQLIVDAIVGLDATIQRFIRPPVPGRLRLVVTGESQMANMLGFKVVLPELPPEPNDIASGELTVQVGAAAPVVVATTKDQVEVADLSGEQGTEVGLTFVYVDDAGNRSEQASTLSVVLTDTIPPPDAGALGLVVTSEFTTEDPVPPEPEPEPPVEPIV